MAGSIVQLTIKDGLGNTRTAEFWSDNGLVTGNLVALHQTVDVNGNPITPLAAGGNIAVNNFPATQNVALTGGINITNFPATQIVTGNVNAVVGSVSVSNFPATQNVAVTGNVVLTNSPTIMSTGTGLASKHVLVDGNTGVSAQVQAWHSSDNVSLGGTTYGMMTGGVDQIVNVYGNLDRKRGMWGDAQPATGLAAHGMMLWNGASYDRAPGSVTKGQQVYSYAPGAMVVGQMKITSNVNVAQMPSATLVNGVVIKTKTTNSGVVFIGGSNAVTTTDDGTGSGYKLIAGEAVSLSVANLANVYIVGTSVNDVIYYSGN